MAGSTRQFDYDLGNVVGTMGTFSMGEYAPDGGITIEYDEDTWEKVVGADGVVIRSRSYNQTGKVTLVVPQASRVNNFLGDAYAADLADGSGKFPISIKDGNTGTTHEIAAAWVMKPPAINYKKSVEHFTWVLDTGQINSKFKGADTKYFSFGG